MSNNYIYQLNGIDKRSDFFIEKIAFNHRLACHICREILIDPYQTQCGCRFCFKCISEYFKKNSKLSCPECLTKISVDIIKDRAVEREILNLEIRCLNNGCNDICELKFLSNHLENCEWRQEICNKCQHSFSYNLKNKHICLNSICKCDYCNHEMTRLQYQTVHINTLNEDISELCENLMTECPYKCNIEISENIKIHLTKCPNKINKCKLFHFGCEFLGNCEDMANHMEQNCASHLLLTISEIEKLKEENIVFKKLMGNNESLKEKIKSVKQENLNLQNQMKILEKNFNEGRNEIENIKSEIRNYRNLIGLEMEESKIDSDLCSINGVCIWTIRNIADKITDAQFGVHLQITSEPFYLSQPGYRFALKIYPNGDGQGKGSFLSIYFIIVKGEFDNELNWPFHNRVGLSLISNDRSVPDLSIYMKPDNNVACYSKPINEFNLGAGQPEFVNLSKLLNPTNHFVRDGSIRIRFEIKSESNRSFSSNNVLQAVRKIKFQQKDFKKN